jgi:hypothetical protein
MAAYAQDSEFLHPPRHVVVAIIALCTSSLLGLRCRAGRKRSSNSCAPPIEADIVEEVEDEDEPPPPPPPEMERPRSKSAAGSFDRSADGNDTTAIQDVTDKPPPPAPPPPPRVAGQPAKMTRPVNPDDFYPPGSIRREEQGSPVVQACVGANGRLLREPVVTDTSVSRTSMAPPSRLPRPLVTRGTERSRAG